MFVEELEVHDSNLALPSNTPTNLSDHDKALFCTLFETAKFSMVPSLNDKISNKVKDLL